MKLIENSTETAPPNVKFLKAEHKGQEFQLLPAESPVPGHGSVEFDSAVLDAGEVCHFTVPGR
jgi:hypothetical protein